MDKRKIKFIVNPNADMGRAWRVAADLRPIMDEYGGADWTGTVYPTHAVELAEQAVRDGYELIIAAGGDGTVHEVMNGIMKFPKDKRPLLGIIPLGSGNDFSHAVGVNEDPFEAVRQVMEGKPRTIDIGLYKDNLGREEYFDNTIGIGFDAKVTVRSHSLPLLRGVMMYFVAVLQTIFVDHTSHHLQLSSDGTNWEQDALMAVLCNGPREGGGFMVSPDSKIDDGKFDYVIVETVSRPTMLRLVPEVMRGTHKRFSQFHFGEFKTLKLVSDVPLTIHIDGEVFAGLKSKVTDIEVEVHPNALDVVV